MGSTFGGIEIGKRALFAQRSAMTTTGHNIANANTEGYSRQLAVMKATNALPYPATQNDRQPGQVGTGVEVTSITRLREKYLDGQYRTTNSEYGFWEGKANVLGMIEDVMNEPSDNGLQVTLDRFWQSWQDLTKEPDVLSAREVVLQRALAVTNTMQQMSGSLQSLKADVGEIMNIKVKDVNSIASQIRDLNDQISRLVPHGYSPNDLYDQRDLLVDQLSKLVSVKETPSPNGMVNISIEGTGGESFLLVNGRQEIGTFDESFPVKKGEIAALRAALGTESEQGDIDRYLGQIDQYATEMAKEINALHRQGVNLDDLKGNVSYENGQRLPFFIDRNWYEANQALFDPPDYAAISAAGAEMDPKRAGDMMINPLILRDSNKIAAASKDSQAFGDGSTATAISKLKFKPLQGFEDKATLDQFYRYTIAKLGMESQEAQRFMENSDMARNTVEARRQSVSGVSLDEEMANMVKYQHAYNAAARSISAMDEMLDKLINGTGRVGL